MPAYRLAILPHVSERIRHLPPDLKRGIREAIRAIAMDPSRGEPLRRELQDYMKFRVRRFRIVYTVNRGAGTINVMAIGHRRTIYEDVAAVIRSRSST